jgi:pimeloyl-ACP methyl ester carboxylesterase
LVPLVLLAALAFVPLQEVEHQTFDSNGVQLHFTLQGEGDALVLLHGFAGNQQVMAGLSATLAKDHWVIAPDVRGHGQSGKPHDPAAYGRELVEDVVRLLDHLGVEKAHVLGYSMGGMTLALVTAHPERVLSAVAGGYGWAEFAPPGEDLMDQVAAALAQGRGFGPLFGEIGPDGARADPQLAATEKALLAANDPLALAAAARSFRHLALDVQALRANRVPTLAIVGDQDELASDVERLKDAMAALEVVVVKGADHATTPARPEFLANVKRFLAQPAPASAAAGD